MVLALAKGSVAVLLIWADSLKGFLYFAVSGGVWLVSGGARQGRKATHTQEHTTQQPCNDLFHFKALPHQQTFQNAYMGPVLLAICIQHTSNL